MKLKTIAAAKLLTANWSNLKLDRYLDQAEIKLSNALDYVMPNNIKVSCVQMALHAETPAKDILDLIVSNLNSAVSDGSQLIVFPEYLGLLPLLSSPSLFDEAYQFSDDLIKTEKDDVEEAMEFYGKHLAQPLNDSYMHFFSTLALKSSIYILAGSTIVKTRNGYANRSFLFDPNGNVVLTQDKLHLTPYEKLCGIKPGKAVSTAQIKLCRVAVLAGMDQRVFEAALDAHMQGAQLLLCPSAFSASRSSAFFQSCAYMRCQEQPMFAVSSWMTGNFMDLPFRAISGIYAPFAASKMGNGIVMQTEDPSSNACLTARIDLERLIQDPDLYISDINPIVDELARKEYTLARETAYSTDDEDEGDSDDDDQQESANDLAQKLPDEFSQNFDR